MEVEEEIEKDGRPSSPVVASNGKYGLMYVFVLAAMMNKADRGCLVGLYGGNRDNIKECVCWKCWC